MKDIGIFIGGLTAIAITLLVWPAFIVLIGWLGGFLVELFLGAKPSAWLNITLGTDRFAQGDLPKVTAMLALAGAYFRARVTVKE